MPHGIKRASDPNQFAREPNQQPARRRSGLYELLPQKINELRGTGQPLPEDLVDLEQRMLKECPKPYWVVSVIDLYFLDRSINSTPHNFAHATTITSGSQL